MKVGIFGGSFNPPHLGHLNSMQIVLKKLGLSKIHMVPAYQNPLKLKTEGPAPEQRLEMSKLAVSSWGSQFEVNDIEIRRGGKSFTIDTIKEFRKSIEAEDLYLIVGMDKWEELEAWKDLKGLLTEANLIVTSRPGFDFPESVESLPPTIKSLVEEFDFNFIELKTGRNIQFVKLNDLEISGTELRKHLRNGKNVEKYIPLGVESYIKANKLYRNLGDRIGDYLKFTEFCSQKLFEKKAIQVKAFDLRKMSAPSEFTIVASGTSTRHTASLAENLMMSVKEEYGLYPQSIEGVDEGRWVVVDYGSLIVHVFYDFIRQEYSIENLWKEGIDLQVKDPTLEK
ncbi:MAG: nicotinate (nicotinamide) nucleotide adenylyltransferase [Proteobacteria bacterium]|jgi:nicotinate-nucleotide adenylyltransferase|nr:nicotinate (nicotinamide) nucleotide adenylyltransferase [Pseudomonadota bacterium]